MKTEGESGACEGARKQSGFNGKKQVWLGRFDPLRGANGENAERGRTAVVLSAERTEEREASNWEAVRKVGMSIK